MKRRQVEAERILRAVRENEYVVALDMQGIRCRPKTSASGFRNALSLVTPTAFVIGGATGLAPDILSRARLRLSMGPMTFPHQFMPMLVAEQLYRAFKIGLGEPYHR